MPAPTIPAALERAAELFGDDEGLVTGDVRLNFAELAAAADAAARAYVASGAEPGDRVALWAPNMAE
jgi:acyl-CoA synthetase (AMP-forming)/AMP-acid ligase II